MESALVIAQLLGPIYLVVGLALAFNPDHYNKVYKDWVKNDSLMYLGGILAFGVGIAILRVHNVWESEWQVLVTIIGWLALLKGVLMVLFPMQAREQFNKWMAGNIMQLSVIICLVLGVVFTYFGYLQ